jgi:multimeric flavodoxin WrbA
MARALIKGVKDSDSRRYPSRTNQTGTRDFSRKMCLTAGAYVFATPENLGAVSGLMKDFFDRCYYPALDKNNGRALCHHDLRWQ